MRAFGVQCKFIMAIKGVTGGIEPEVHEASGKKRGAL